MVPIIGGDGQIFISNFKEWCSVNLPKLESGRLNEFMLKGWFWSNELRQDVLCKRWRRAEEPPEDAEAELASFLRQASSVSRVALPDYAQGVAEHAGGASLYQPHGSSSGVHGACLGAFESRARAREPCIWFHPNPCP